MADTSKDDIRGDGVTDAGGHLKSVYMTNAETMRDRLNAVSPSLCLAKWLQVSIHLTNGHTQSCYHPRIHKVPLDEVARDPSALHNTEHKKVQRKAMLDGQRPKECQYCWNVEDLGPEYLSDRHYRSGEPWAAERFDEVAAMPWDANVTPAYVEVNFNQTCNLKCSYCSPHLSSSWQAEIEQHGPYPTALPHNDLGALRGRGLMPYLGREDNPYVDAFWTWWPELYPKLKVFRMTGGEPLLDKNTFRVMDWVIANPKADLDLSITSNMCPPEELWRKFMDKLAVIDDGGLIDHFMLFVSLDQWGRKAEYIRNGMDFEMLLRRTREYLGRVKHGSLTFIVTYNLFSVPGFSAFLDGVLALRREFSVHRQMVWFDTPILHAPSWQSVKILPKEYCQYVEQDIAFMRRHIETRETRFKGFKDYEIAKLERVLEQMKQPLPDDALRDARADFVRFFDEHDRRRGTDLLETFPELQDFYELCHDAAHAS